ncbi:adenosylcobalamin-dependent ribonucleoside-diphosphate reductase [Alicyclobacillus shizuokensis]|uniref:adenosylcobalamin-dependent ribonucleoside-diphosphate reductase n=1 Tax=Alicyclobacillus shizuokensis TaxID=392014 RepID=UPI0014707889|nr:adenosylcobalamin-dependent ribonucleoside-diphosphate reductase [Alicyclobacillus shizuokensis]
MRETATVTRVDGETVHMILTSGDMVGQEFSQNIAHVDALVETEWEHASERVSTAVAGVEKPEVRKSHQKKFHHAISNFLLIPAGRILSGAGDDSFVTLFNCYVTAIKPPKGQERYGRDSRQAIFHTMGFITEIMARGGGNGTCLSVLRPKYATLSQTKGKSAGAVHTGNMISSLTDWVEQANRRGAQMLTLHDWHPDVFYTADENDSLYNEDFIGAKNKPGFMEGNNSSVLVSDAFMHAVEHDLNWDLVFPDTTHPAYNLEWDGDLNKWKAKGYPVKVYRTIRARDMWKKIIHCNWRSAEPGIIFIDTCNRMHNGWYLGTIMATNPCGEQPILDGSTCNLGAINWGRMIKPVGEDELGTIYDVDWDLLKKTVWAGVRFLDNVIDVSFYWDKDLERWQKGERRVGLGGMGIADFLIAMRKRYGSKEGNELIEKVMRFIRDEAYRCSIELAKEKGPFPFFDRDKYLESGFVKTLPEDIQQAIYEHGIRNLTLLTFAPTGTTGSVTPSLLDPEGSVSTGCEPHFAMKYHRLSRVGSTIQYAGVAKTWIDEHPGQELPEWFVGAMDLTPEEHVGVQAALQKYVDSSISKTVNCPADYTEEQVAEVYMLLYKSGCKGGTIYRDGSRYEQILSLTDEEEAPETAEEKAGETNEMPAVQDKYANWECVGCGSKSFVLVENCPQCTECGLQVCSIGGH